MSGTKRNSRRVLLAASAGAIALLGGHAAFAADGAPGASNVEEVVVTVQKRPEVLSKVPQSVTVVSQDSLQKLQASDFQDYAKLIPGLNLQSDTPGITRITLRGVNTGGVASTVAVYLDELPFGSSSGLANGSILAGDFDTWDASRIEVLRGPQGTLYGASSLGGVLKFVTNTPTHQREMQAEGSVESVDDGGVGYSFKAMINVPAGDKFALRASGFYHHDAGWIDSIGNNPVTNVVFPAGQVITSGTQVAENFNESEKYGGRISALFTPTDDLSIRLTASSQNIRSEGSNNVIADQNLDQLYGGNVQNRYLFEPHTFNYRVYSGVVNWDLGPVTLTSATGYSRFKEGIFSDGTYGATPFSSIASALAALGAYGPGHPGPYSAALVQQTATNKFTQEVRLSSNNNEKFEWLGGVYYTKEDSGINPQQIIAVDPVTGADAGVAHLADVFLNSTYKEYAFFGNATAHFSPRFDLTFGARWSHNSQSAVEFLDETGLFPILDIPIVTLNAASSESVFTYSVAPRFNLNDNSNIYARIASGYRPGGPNILPVNAPPGTPATYSADRITNYEVGYKGHWGMASLDLAAFWIDWKDIQLFAIVNGVGVNGNGGTAVSRGFEGSFTMRPNEHLTLTANAAYTDAYLTQDTPPVVGGFKGDPLPNIPKFQGTVDAEYRWPAFNDMDAFAGATLAYQSDRPADFGLVDLSGQNVKAPAYATVDIRLGLQNDRWMVLAYVKNLTNKAGVTNVSGGPGTEYGDNFDLGLIRPRTIGVTVGAKF